MNTFNNPNINYLSMENPAVAEQIQQQRERMALAEAYRQNSFKVPQVKNKTGRAVRGWGQALTSLGKFLTDIDAENKMSDIRARDKQDRADAQALSNIIQGYDNGDRPTEDLYDGTPAFNQAVEQGDKNYGYDPREGLVKSLIDRQMPQGRFENSEPIIRANDYKLTDAIRRGGFDPANLNYYQQQIMADRANKEQALAQRMADQQAFYNKEAIKHGFAMDLVNRKAENAMELENLRNSNRVANLNAMVNPDPDMTAQERKAILDEFTGYRDKATELNKLLGQSEELFGDKGVFSPGNKETKELQDDGYWGQLVGTLGDKYGRGDGSYSANLGKLQAYLAQFTMNNAERLKGSLSDKDVQFLKETVGTLGDKPTPQNMLRAARAIHDTLKKAGLTEIINKATPRYQLYKDSPRRTAYARSLLEGAPGLESIYEPQITLE